LLLTIDIETLPSDDDAVRAELAATILPPGNMSKAETIAAWTVEKKPALIDEAVLKTSFDAAYGRILCIGWAVDDTEPQSIIGSEDIVLHGFMDALRAAQEYTIKSGKINADVVFIGHNVAGFDLRFLFQRCVINAVKPPLSLLTAMRAKPWDRCVFDTMTQWQPDRDKRISLDKLCRALGVPSPKGELDGSKVFEYFKAGRLDEIAEYCRKDVWATRECYKRLVFA